MLNFLSPSMSARSFVMEMTTAKIVTKQVMNRMGGDHEGQPERRRGGVVHTEVEQKSPHRGDDHNAASAERLRRIGGTL